MKRIKCPKCKQLKDPEGFMIVRAKVGMVSQKICGECAEKAKKQGALVVSI